MGTVVYRRCFSVCAFVPITNRKGRDASKTTTTEYLSGSALAFLYYSSRWEAFRLKMSLANNSGVWTEHSVYNSSVLPVVELPVPLGESNSKDSSREMEDSNVPNNQPERQPARVMELASSGTSSIYSSHHTNSVAFQPAVVPPQLSTQYIRVMKKSQENPCIIEVDNTEEAPRTAPTQIQKPLIKILGVSRLIEGVPQPVTRTLPPA